MMAFSEYSGVAQTVQAEKIEEDRAVITPNGPVEGRSGEYEVRTTDGNVFTLTEDEFEALYGSGEKKESVESTRAGTYSGSGADSGQSPDEAGASTTDDAGEDTGSAGSGPGAATPEHPGRTPSRKGRTAAKEDLTTNADDSADDENKDSDETEDKFPKK